MGSRHPSILGIDDFWHSRHQDSSICVSLLLDVCTFPQSLTLTIRRLYNMSIQLSSIIGANVYQPSDAPRYYTANKAMLAVVVFNLVIVYPGTWLFFGHVNKKRERIWGGMSNEEKSEYLRTTKDEGNKRLDFRFAR
jgi:hypothetical protein